MKVALRFAYDGTGFHGFARQPGMRTVQGTLEDALALLLRSPVSTTGAGRTDTGVHAVAQVVSFEVPGEVRPDRLRGRLNKLLGPEIGVDAVAEVPEAFDARFSALRRSYEYRLYRSEVPDPFADRFALRVADPLSIPAMRAGARALVGEHDFSSFCRRGQGSLTRRIRRVAVVPAGRTLTVKLDADSFCHQMVRSIVGLLLEVGRGRREPSDVVAVLAARDRSAGAPIAPARGLHLVRVTYRPDPFAPRARRRGVS